MYEFYATNIIKTYDNLTSLSNDTQIYNKHTDKKEIIDKIVYIFTFYLRSRVFNSIQISLFATHNTAHIIVHKTIKYLKILVSLMHNYVGLVMFIGYT